MENNSLVELLRELEALAIGEGCIGLVPLIDQAWAAAHREVPLDGHDLFRDSSPSKDTKRGPM